MIAVLRTTWTVSLASYADENGIDEDQVPADLGARTAVSAAGCAEINVDWRIKASREGWLHARGLSPRSSARSDLLHCLARELYDLPSLCETDAVMVARYQLDGRRVRREFRPEQRRRAA